MTIDFRDSTHEATRRRELLNTVTDRDEKITTSGVYREPTNPSFQKQFVTIYIRCRTRKWRRGAHMRTFTGTGYTKDTSFKRNIDITTLIHIGGVIDSKRERSLCTRTQSV